MKSIGRYRVVFLFVTLCFVFNSITYGIDFSEKSHLRVPIGNTLSPEDMAEALVQSRIKAIKAIDIQKDVISIERLINSLCDGKDVLEIRLAQGKVLSHILREPSKKVKEQFPLDCALYDNLIDDAIAWYKNPQSVKLIPFISESKRVLNIALYDEDLRVRAYTTARIEISNNMFDNHIAKRLMELLDDNNKQAANASRKALFRIVEANPKAIDLIKEVVSSDDFKKECYPSVMLRNIVLFLSVQEQLRGQNLINSINNEHLSDVLFEELFTHDLNDTHIVKNIMRAIFNKKDGSLDILIEKISRSEGKKATLVQIMLELANEDKNILMLLEKKLNEHYVAGNMGGLCDLGIDIKQGKIRRVVSEEHRLEALGMAKQRVDRFWEIGIGDKEMEDIINSFKTKADNFRGFIDEVNAGKEVIKKEELQELMRLLEMPDDTIEDLGLKDTMAKDQSAIEDVASAFGNMDEFKKIIGLRISELDNVFETGMKIYKQNAAGTKLKDMFSVKAISMIGSGVRGKDGRPGLGISQNFTDKSDFDLIFLCNWEELGKKSQQEMDALWKIISATLGYIELNGCRHKLGFIPRGWEELDGLYNYTGREGNESLEDRIRKVMSDSFAIEFVCGELIKDDNEQSAAGIFKEIKKRCAKNEHLQYLIEGGIDSLDKYKGIASIEEALQKENHEIIMDEFLQIPSFVYLVICDIEFRRPIGIGDRMIVLKEQLKDTPVLYDTAMRMVGADCLYGPAASEEAHFLSQNNPDFSEKDIVNLRIKRLRDETAVIYTYLIDKVRPEKPWGKLTNPSFWWNNYYAKISWLKRIDESIEKGDYREAVCMLLRTVGVCYSLISYQQKEEEYEEIKSTYYSILERFGYLDKGVISERLETSKSFLKVVIDLIRQYKLSAGNSLKADKDVVSQAL